MRFGRWLILAAILLIAAFVGDTYMKRKALLDKDAPAAPAPLEAGIEARGNNWCFTQSEGDKPRVEVCAERNTQLADPSVMQLEGVQLKLYQKGSSEYDLVKSEKAQFDIHARTLYSDGDVEITLGVNTEGPPRGRVVKIRSSGVRFASDTGKVGTDRAANFELDTGGGSAKGAEYDPNSRELHLLSQVSLDWRGKTPDAKPMHIDAGEAVYQEKESRVTLMPWSKLTRESLHLDAGVWVIALEKGEIEHADVRGATGVQDDPGRKVEFAADLMGLHFGDSMLLSHIDGEQHARLVSTSDNGRTTVTGNHLELNFGTTDKQSTLETSMVTGGSVAESVPLPKPGAVPADTRVLRSETIRLKMRSGGKEIETAETDGPGTLDFLPNRSDQPKRNLQGDKIWIAYGGENRVQSFRSVNVSTRTEKPAQQGKMPPPPAVTQSKDFLATFDPVTGDLAKVEQWTNFRYQEGDSQAHADRAVLDQQKDVMTLEGSARAWDMTGSAAADRIVMNQKTGDYTADGHVASTRQPDKQGKSSAMLSADEVLQARAQRMTSTERNKKIRYEGKPGEQAVAWQGANRIQADRLDIDREGQTLEAHGNVVSQFADKNADKNKDASSTASKAAPKQPAAAVYTVVRAPDMTYNDDTRLAVYQGGAVMSRPDLNVVSREIKAYLKDSSSDSSLDKAFADGAVKIDSTSPTANGQKRKRTGTSEHSEYYADEGKVIMQGGQPLLVDSIKGKTTGKQLTWWSNNDRLLVDGEESKPAQSTIRKK
jgi:lipopolysaccharide export system protein LptA